MPSELEVVPLYVDGLGGIYLRPQLITWLRISIYLIGFNPFIILVKLVLPSDNVHQAEGDPGVQHAGHVDHPLLGVATMRMNGREG